MDEDDHNISEISLKILVLVIYISDLTIAERLIPGQSESSEASGEDLAAAFGSFDTVLQTLPEPLEYCDTPRISTNHRTTHTRSQSHAVIMPSLESTPNQTQSESKQRQSHTKQSLTDLSLISLAASSAPK